MVVDAALGLAAVRMDVEDACGSLILASPEGMKRCEETLKRAAADLGQGRTGWDWESAGEAARIQAVRLEAGIRRAARLLSTASRYHAGWLHILSAMTGGYSPLGEAAPMPSMRRISFEG